MKPSLFLLLIPATLVAQTDLGQRIESLLNASPAASRAHWGIQVTDVADGALIYRRNSASYFVPASNTKLFSTSLALTRLGPDHRMTTRIVAEALPDSAGVIKGDLRFCGGGDTTISNRSIPYRFKQGREGDPLRAIEGFAAELAARGIRRIEGDIVGDDSAYRWEPFAPGWALDDPTWEYGAPVSAIVINDNAFTLSIAPGLNAGDPAFISLDPALEHFTVLNRVLTSAGGSPQIRCVRQVFSTELEVRGEIPAGGAASEELLAIGDPALYAATALRDALERRGIAVTGRCAVRHREGDASASADPNGTAVAVRTSPPLIEMLRVVDKVSQNLHAEIMLREVARVRRGFGSRQGGLEELKSFLAEVGVNGDGYSINDGSGLSRLNLLTPETVTKLLVYMAKSPYRDAWIGLLPVAGEDGTIGSRFIGTPAAGRVHAKTGTLSHVSALSGYIEGKGGRLLAFSIFVNNYRSESREVRDVMDQVVNLLVLDRAPGDSPIGGLVYTPDGGIRNPGGAPASGSSR